jgi:hypothetical protein
MSNDTLRRGDLVEVKSPAEVLATLDERGALEDLPFMPEMAALCGRRFVVDGRAERICDTVQYSGTRNLPGTVLLADLRCDGCAHGGCEAECRFFWKEAWLRKVAPGAPASLPTSAHDLRALLDRTTRHARRTVEVEGRPQERWWCQATELPTSTFRERASAAPPIRRSTSSRASSCRSRARRRSRPR